MSLNQRHKKWRIKKPAYGRESRNILIILASRHVKQYVIWLFPISTYLSSQMGHKFPCFWLDSIVILVQVVTLYTTSFQCPTKSGDLREKVPRIYSVWVPSHQTSRHELLPFQKGDDSDSHAET